MKPRTSGWRGMTFSAAVLSAGMLIPVADVSAQELSGRIVDSANGAPVGLAAVFLLDAERKPVASSAADVEGYYTISAPSTGEFYLIVERLGYFENESPLLAVESIREYGIDMEMRPEPFRLDPLEVTVRNEQLEDFLTLSFGQHPATIPGYRSIQGIRLEEAKLKSEDNTELLRWLYIPIWHGRSVCIGVEGAPLPVRTGADRTNARADAAAEDPDARAQCGALYLNGYRCRNEHIELIDQNQIAVVVTFRGAAHLYTRDFDWTFKRGGESGAC
jgi:Carboxypeptidase regulatory-like domain